MFSAIDSHLAVAKDKIHHWAIPLKKLDSKPSGDPRLTENHPVHWSFFIGKSTK